MVEAMVANSERGRPEDTSDIETEAESSGSDSESGFDSDWSDDFSINYDHSALVARAACRKEIAFTAEGDEGGGERMESRWEQTLSLWPLFRQLRRRT